MTRRRGDGGRLSYHRAFALAAIFCALSVASGASARTAPGFAFTGEARVLEMTVSGQKAVYGLAMSGASLRPEAVGIAAGQCRGGKNVGLIDPACSAENTEMSQSSGNRAKEEPDATCSESVAKPRTVVSIRTACGKSTSHIDGELPFTENIAKVPGLTTMLELDQLLALTPGATRIEIEAMAHYLAGRFSPVLGGTSLPTDELVKGVTRLVADYLELAGRVDRGELIRMRFGRAISSIAPEGSGLAVESTFSGARIGFLPIPERRPNGSLELGDPLTDGLIIIEVSPAKASAQVDQTNATAEAYAAAASVTLRVRDLSKAKARYVQLAVAPGEELTLFDGTTWRSTISVGSATTEEGVGLADAVAEPVSLTLLEAMGGVTVEVGRAHARADLAARSAPAKPKAHSGALPATGGAKPFFIPILAVLSAGAVFVVGRRAVRAGHPLATASQNVRRFGVGILSTRLKSGAPIDLTSPVVKMKRICYRSLAGMLAASGVVFVSYPFATDVWASRIESDLRGDLSRMTTEYVTNQVDVGDPLTRLEIPRLDVDIVVVEGITEKALRAGAGHYPMTPLPGEPGNVAIAGHRTSFGRPFQKIDALMPGDEIILTTPVGRHTYEVLARPSVTDPHDWSIITDTPESGSYLTLTSCHPEGSADYRIWLRAELVESVDTREAAR